jgi:single-strand DNA-binding protein
MPTTTDAPNTDARDPDAPEIDTPPDSVPVAAAVFEPVNTVLLCGTVSDPAEVRQMAGGAEVVRWTMRVPRTPERTGTDLIDCVALHPVLQQRALAWPLGTVLNVEGALRRRFFRSAGRTVTRVEVEAEAVSLG